jgi:hypothetical protein
MFCFNGQIFQVTGTASVGTCTDRTVRVRVPKHFTFFQECHDTTYYVLRFTIMLTVPYNSSVPYRYLKNNLSLLYQARNQCGQIGLVPSNYLLELSQFLTQDVGGGGAQDQPTNGKATNG